MSRSITITIGKKDYRVIFDHNAIADLEDKAGLGIGQLFRREMGFASTRLLLWAGLRRAVPGLTLERAGQMLDTYVKPVDERGNGGTLEDISTALLKAVMGSGLFKGASEADLDEIEAPQEAADDDEGEATAN